MIKDEKLEERKKAFLGDHACTSAGMANNIFEYAKKLRKQKRDDQLDAIRNRLVNQELENNLEGVEESSDYKKKLYALSPILIDPKGDCVTKLQIIAQFLSTTQVTDIELLYGLAFILREMSLKSSAIALPAMFQYGLIGKLVAFLDIPDDSVRIQAAWALANVSFTSGEFTTAILKECKKARIEILAKLLELDGHYKLANLAKTANLALKENCLWALANIAGECCEYRDDLLQNTSLPEIIIGTLSASDVPTNLYRTACFTISNLCRGKPSPHLKKIRMFLPLLSKTIYVQDEEINSVRSRLPAL